MFKFFISSWLGLWQFVKKPIEERDQKQNNGYKLGQLCSILILDLAIMFVLILLISVVEEIGLIDADSHKVLDFMQSKPLLGLFSAVIIAPIFEEFFFRTYIVKRYSPIRLIAFLSDTFGIYSKEKIFPTLESFWDRYYTYMVYFSAVVFAFVHIFNYELSTNIWLLSPVLVAPQFVMGLILAYFRVRFGLFWSMCFHALHNLVLIGPAIFFLLQQT